MFQKLLLNFQLFCKFFNSQKSPKILKSGFEQTQKSNARRKNVNEKNHSHKSDQNQLP